MSSNGIDLSHMPPCQKTLKLHIKRTNSQTLIWRMSSFSQPQVPNAEGNGWKVGISGLLEINWYDDNFVPHELLDILSDKCQSKEIEQDNDDDVVDDDYDDDVEEDEDDELDQ